MDKCITFAVTNDLTYDQRMQRICSSLATNGFKVKLIGRKLRTSILLKEESYKQKRLSCWATKGKLMYLEFNVRLFVYLLFTRGTIICAIDLDTILPCYFASAVKGTKRVYDAHELFTEQKEIVTRPKIQKMWLKVERFAVPKFKNGYTVNKFIADELERRYGVKYEVVKNLPTLKPYAPKATHQTLKPFIIYQGAVNEGRCFETLIPAMKDVDAKLVICGEGNFFEETKRLVKKHKVMANVQLKGYVPPPELAALTPTAYVAVTLFENVGLNQFHSLANRFFDYIMAGVPQVCVGYPEYEAINDKYGVAYMVYDTSSETIAKALNNLLSDGVLYQKLKENCLKAREVLNWQLEEKRLLGFYHNLLQH
jgi:glycosyltransferase involved in cell wall biosynthesis